ncbi:MAG: PAS domain S-box protein, partial [Ignavibacteriales bacterium]|nr:PAS domain S-box protein [Ignavibacteriales bacterium]
QPMWVYDLETLSFLAVNDAAVNHYGYSRDEFLAMTIKDIRPPEDIPALVQNLQRSTADLEKASQWRHHKKDGTFIDVEITSHTLRFSGRPARLVAVNDVTERKRAEEALRQSEDRYRRLVESSPVAIIIHTEGKIVYANGEAAKLLAAQTPNELIGKSILGFAHPDYREIVQERLRQVRKGGDVPLVEEKFIRLDRVVIDIEVAGIPFMYQGKLGAQVIFRDITERKRAEEAIRKSEEKYRNLFEESKDVIFISSPECKFLDINPAGVNLFGYSTKQELLGVDIDQDLYGDPKERETLHHILEQHGFVRDYELIAKKKDGQKLFLLETVTAVRDAAGNVLSYRGIIRDETQRKQLEQQLFQTQKMESLGTLASGIAHDFNNILGIVMGHASLIEMSKNKPEDFPASIKALNNAARRGAGLVRQLLTFARKSELLFEPVSIHSTVDEITRLLGETFPKTITTVTKIEQHLPMIHADATQLHQVMLNLCVNARDAMPRGGTLSITATRVTCEAVRHTFPKASASEYIAINVSDTGMGMDEATKKRIFEPFFTTKDRDKGTGLGLATVYGIIQSHHGFIDVESTIGKGTTFYLYFPVQQSADDNLRSKEGEREEIAGGAETILVVEDEEMLRELVKTILSTKGYTILTANDGVQAIEVYKNHALEIALVLSDVGLPKLEGTEVFLKVKDLNPKVKVILASGFWDPEMKAALFGSGIKDCIQKPYSPNELLKSVRRVLDE